jgi:hypothetical protein
VGFGSNRHAYADANRNAYVDPNANADTHCIADA